MDGSDLHDQCGTLPTPRWSAQGVPSSAKLLMFPRHCSGNGFAALVLRHLVAKLPPRHSGNRALQEQECTAVFFTPAR